MFPGPVSPAQSERHYGCFMLTCRIPLKRLMPGSLSQLRTCYPPAACSDLVNEFIILAAGSALQTLCRVKVGLRVSHQPRLQENKVTVRRQQLRIMAGDWVLLCYIFQPEDAKKLFFLKMSTLQELCKNKFWRESVNLEVTSVRRGENWIPQQKSRTHICLALFLNMFTRLDSFFFPLTVSLNFKWNCCSKKRHWCT